MSQRWHGPLEPAGTCRWRIPETYRDFMRVPGLIYAHEDMLDALRQDQAPEQVAHVASLPGIVKASLAMPDIHYGYGFSIGGVAATDARDGVIVPGGIGYDINCGVRLLRSDLTKDEVSKHAEAVVNELYTSIPSGVGSRGPLRLDASSLKRVLEKGAHWAVEEGYGEPDDLEYCEEGGCMEGAQETALSQRARKRGLSQQGTLGSGNHFLEMGIVDEVFDDKGARALDLFPDQVVFMVHSGSRGLGHQVCSDFLNVMGSAVKKYDIKIPDRQLACAPLASQEGQDYFAAMAAAANYAWANRQIMTHWVRQAVARALHQSAGECRLKLVYDVAHNIAKRETHTVDGEMQDLCVHRKGATRAFGPGRPEVPARYREWGQPVLVPGDMGTASYVLLGTQRAMEETFGSTCHGAGRRMSRTAAKKRVDGRQLKKDLASRGIFVRAGSAASLAEEAPDAYKDVHTVVTTVEQAGISRIVARLRPLGVVKG